MTVRIARIVGLVLLSALVVPAAIAQELPAGVSRGLREFQAGDFAAALSSFREATPSAPEAAYAGYGEFWVARTLMALERYTEAADAFDLFLDRFPEHPYREESEYQRARLFYLGSEYEAAIQRFGLFLERHPESDFAANALYWTGEALFSLGRLGESRRFFEEVTESYPTSFRVEAARYRLNVIDLKQRENELLTLLQWSHEEYLSALEEFRQKELAYQEALAAYRNRLASLAEEDFRKEIELLNGQITDLRSELSQRDARINELLAELRQARSSAPAVEPADAGSAGAGGSSTGTGSPGGSASAATAAAPSAADIRGEILSLKADALELQQRLMQLGGAE